VEVEIRDLQGLRVDESLLRDAARAALTRARGQLDALSLALVDDQRMQALNCRYRGVDAPTDVIAFEAEPQAEGAIGEVIVSVETAGRQAAEAGHSLQRELCLLVAHGVLHVLGYQDVGAEGTARMAALQDQVLSDMKESLQGHEH
jgi:probable rRNA maturation factor